MVAETHTATRVGVDTVRDWLSDVPDPEIPVMSVIDLGIVRGIDWLDDESESVLRVTVTPTYSGCPAHEVIVESIRRHLRERGIERVDVRTRVAPPWTTDWISDAGRRKLERYGIAPPRPRGDDAPPACPLCGSLDTECLSRFGSTPCKALHRCRACLEPFDYFKCH